LRINSASLARQLPNLCWHGRRNCQLCPGSHCRASGGDYGAAVERHRDSRECPGPTTEAELSCPSTRRVLTAGAMVLAVIAPAVDPAEHPAAAGSPPPPSTTPALAQRPGFDSLVLLSARPSAGQRVSRSTPRRIVRSILMARPTAMRIRKVVREEIAPVRRAVQRRIHRSASRHGLSRRVIEPVPLGMAAVIAFARTQIGKDYIRGGEGPNGYDCSGFTKLAYARAGLWLPHSSGAQAARARTISRSAARAGDLVVGPGHVGVYMGGGMMIDAGNPRTGVIYRHLFAGLHIERF
jgi:peptidoglycan DL-endopeptidase CwlO